MLKRIVRKILPPVIFPDMRPDLYNNQAVQRMLHFHYQAAVGLAQLEKLDEHVRRKRRMGKLYTELLTGIPELQLPLPKTDYAENIYWIYGIILKDQVSFAAEEAMRRLKEKGIGTRPFFWPMHEQPVFRKMGLFVGENYPVAERIARKGFYIPSGLALTDEQIEIVASAIGKILQ